LDYEHKKVFLVNTAFAVLIGITVYLVSRFMLAYLLPFLISAVLSYMLARPAELFGKKTGVSSDIWRCLLLATVYFFLVLSAVLIFWVCFKYLSGFIVTAKDYIASEDNIFHKIGEFFSSVTSGLPKDIKEPIDRLITDLPDKIAELAADIIPTAVAAITRFFPAFLISSVVTVVASFYIAKDYKRLIKFIKNLMGKKRFLKLCEIKEIFVESVCKMVGGYFIMALITFAVSWLGFGIIGVGYSAVIALLVAAVDLLPVLGAGTVLLPWATICFLNGQTGKGFSLIFIYGLITVIRNFAEPKIIGKRLDINPLLMLITVFVGLRIGGVAGMFILPVTVIVVITYYKKELAEEKIKK